MAERTLSTRELNRALLARQHLLERSSASLPATLERIGGIQMQSAPAGYLGLWTRMRDLRPTRVTRALERRHVVQATLMRVTIHLVSARDYWPLTAGIRAARRAWWLRTAAPAGVDTDLMDEVGSMVRRLLRDGPRPQRALVEAIVAAGHPRALWGGVGLWVDLVRVPPSGTWERPRADLLALATAWLAPTADSEAEGLSHLVRRYLRGFGPARVADIADWAGLPARTVAAAVDGLAVRRFRDPQGRLLVDLPRAPLPPADTPAPVRFLPPWDATLLVHCRRTQILPERHRPRIFRTTLPRSVGTFLVDGAVAGTWRLDDGDVQTEPFEPLPRGVARAIADEAGALARFHA